VSYERERIQELIEIENKARDLLATAEREAERLPIQAELEAREEIERARAGARDEARKILEQAQAEDPASEIMARAQERMGESDGLAAKNLEKAVAYVLELVVGKA